MLLTFGHRRWNHVTKSGGTVGRPNVVGDSLCYGHSLPRQSIFSEVRSRPGRARPGRTSETPVWHRVPMGPGSLQSM